MPRGAESKNRGFFSCLIPAEFDAPRRITSASNHENWYCNTIAKREWAAGGLRLKGAREESTGFFAEALSYLSK
jgi:hypothetical protein